MNWNRSEYLASWPKAVPYPYAIARSPGAVPNRSSVDWPQAQWAPLYLKPGSPSVQPYRYPANGRIQSIVPDLTMAPTVKYAQRGPSGDIVAVPSAYAGIEFYGDATAPVRIRELIAQLEQAIKDHKSTRRDRRRQFESSYDKAVERAKANWKAKKSSRKEALKKWDREYDTKLDRMKRRLKALESTAEKREEAYQELYLDETLTYSGKRYTEDSVRSLSLDALKELFVNAQKRLQHLTSSDVKRSESEVRYLEDLKYWVGGAMSVQEQMAQLGYGDMGCGYGCGDYGCAGIPNCGCSSCANNNPSIMERWDGLTNTHKLLLVGGVVGLGYWAYSTGKLDRLLGR